MRRLVACAAVAVLTVMLVTAGPAAAAEPTLLTIDAEREARTGEPHEITVTLTDARGTPVPGQSVTVFERVRFFDYVDTVRIGQVRTNHRGAATVTHVPSVPGPGRLIAEYAGVDGLRPATGALAYTVAEGVGVATPVLPGPPEPLLPRGVTALWFLPLLVGVWLAIAAAVYNALRIPVEREVRHEV